MRNRPIPNIKPEDAAFARSLLIHEDAAVLGFNKPSGLAVQTRGGRGPTLDFLLWAFAKSNGKRPRLVHRLDAGTSGVIVAARTQPAAASLSESFAERRAEKTYLALARGSLPDREAGVVDQAMKRVRSDRGGREVMTVSDAESAQSARTAWRIVARSEDTALFELRPETGRTHQIRVHLAHLGCPILGDAIYGAGALSAPRLMLHAARLALPHPDGGALDLAAASPPDMQALIDKLS